MPQDVPRRRCRDLGHAPLNAEPRPAFYALARGGWRDYVTLLHLPYTAWHLSYVAIGAALAPVWRPERLAWTLLAFFLALGIGAHALDELNGRPLRTKIPRRVLWSLAIASTAGATVIGFVTSLAWSTWLLTFVAVGLFFVYAYNLELYGGRLHGDVLFALGWGAFPLLTAYFACAERLRVEAIVAAAFAAITSAAQRTLSTPVRDVRRRATGVRGSIAYGGREEPITTETLTRAPEAALLLLAAGMVALAAALVLVRAV